MHLEEYYSKLFPYGSLQLLMEPPVLHEFPLDLNRCGRREVAFGFMKYENGRESYPIFQRMQMFRAGQLTTQQLLKQRFSRTSAGSRIDLGGVYAVDATVAKRSEAKPIFRELIIDVDLDKEYKSFRTCQCADDEKKPPFVCDRCWPFLTVAIQVTEHLLNHHFGFYDTLWLFSGRRGVHCWVLDYAAGVLTDPARRRIAEFFERFTRPNANPSQWFDSQPHLGTLYSEILQPRLSAMIQRQQVKLSERSTLQVIADSFTGIPDHLSLTEILKQLEKCAVADQSFWWAKLIGLAENYHYQRALINISFYVMFPRLDYNVMPTGNHLLRCPMSVHADTQSVAVPLDLDKMDDIDPISLPNLAIEHTLIHFEEYTRRLQNLLLCRLPVASYYICPLCTSDHKWAMDFMPDDLFHYNKVELRRHYAEQHATTTLRELDGCTLRDWVNRVSLRPDGTVDRAKKYELYRTLQQRFSR